MRQKSAGRIEIIKKGRDTILKFNPYHGYHGSFSSRDAHSSFSPGSNAADAARSIAKEIWHAEIIFDCENEIYCK